MSSVPQKIEITTKTFFTALGVLAGTVVVYKLRDILLQIFIALILMAAFNPLVARVQKWQIFNHKINRASAVILIYVFCILIIATFISIIAQPLTTQTTKLLNQLPKYISSFGSTYQVDTAFLTQFISQLGGLSSNLFTIISGFFSNVLNIFTTAVISFYLLLERNNLHKYLSFLLGNPKLETRIERLVNQVEIEMGGWVRAQLLLMLIVGCLSYVGFLLLGIPYALPLAIVAGFLEIVPNIGPSIAAIPAIISGFSLGLWFGIGALSWSVFVQQVENHIIVPQIMSRNTGVKPLVTILALVVGLALAGVAGAILAVPTVLVARAIIQEFYLNDSPAKE